MESKNVQVMNVENDSYHRGSAMYWNQRDADQRVQSCNFTGRINFSNLLHRMGD